MKLRKPLVGALAAAGVATAIALATGGAANAATTAPAALPVPVIAPGGTGDIGAEIDNQFGFDQSGVVTLILKAPPNSTFTSTTVWGTQIHNGVKDSGSSPVFTNCQLSADAMQLKCTGTLTVPAASNGKLGGIVLTSQIKVADDAPLNTFSFSERGFQLTNSADNAISGGNAETHFDTPKTQDAPMINPAVGASAAGVVGLGAAGFLLRRKRRLAHK